MPESLGLRKLVPCPRNSIYFVAIKMGRLQGGPSRTGGRSEASRTSFTLVAIRVNRGGRQTGAGRDRRATQPPAHFHRNPSGRGRLAVFLRCSLDPYDSDMGASFAP
jgi:hypothetical protein